MSRNLIVTLNSGSSSLRCGVFARTGGDPEARLRLSLYDLPARMTWERKDAVTGETEVRALDPPEDPGTAQEAARAEMLRRLLDEIEEDQIAAMSHRVVHGGRDYRGPVATDAAVLADLEALSPLAPSHQPHNLAAIRDMAERFPEVPQIACFDTAFHRTLSRNDRIFALAQGADRGGRRALRLSRAVLRKNVAEALAPDRAGPRARPGRRGASWPRGQHVRAEGRPIGRHPRWG